MLKKIGIGFLWFIVFYIVPTSLIGGIAGGFAGVEDPNNAYQAGAVAGASAVGPYRIYIVILSAGAAAIGTVMGYLPGTKDK